MPARTGEVTLEEVEANAVRCPDPEAAAKPVVVGTAADAGWTLIEIDEGCHHHQGKEDDMAEVLSMKHGQTGRNRPRDRGQEVS